MIFFERNKRLLVALLLIIVTIGLAWNERYGTSLIRAVLYPIINRTASVTQTVTQFVDEKYIHDAKEAEIARLTEENARLRKELITLNQEQKDLEDLTELKKMLNYRDEKIFEQYLSAELIAKDGSDFYSTFLISVGEGDGVKRGDLVLSGNGLAGVVESVQSGYSKVLSILDAQLSISFQAVRSDAINGIVSQNIDAQSFENLENGFLKGYVFDNADILVGDIVITSGMGVYPAGIEIGEIDQVIEDHESLMKYVIIRPYTDFHNLKKLLVVQARVLE